MTYHGDELVLSEAEGRVTLYLGDCREVIAGLDPCSVDAIVTDPPYELGFMGKAWDAAGVTYDVATWAAALRVLKPGGHLVAFGAPRTYHRLACAIEDAGFEVRDCLMWLYGSGFPKSLDVSKALDKAAGAEREIVGRRAKRGGVVATGNFRDDDWQPNADRLLAETAPATPDAERWQGWGTALKPAYEPVILARRPLAGTVAQNVLAYGTGGLNVDGCRIEAGDLKASDYDDSRRTSPKFNGRVYGVASLLSRGGATPAGRWPANLLLDEAAAALLDAQAGERDGASRFYYTAKASRSEREAGLDGFDLQRRSDGRDKDIDNPRLRTSTRRNDHPTVKPVSLMRWLCRLVTPPGGVVLDPFMGSGSTRVAALAEGMRFVGIDLEPRYVDVAGARLAQLGFTLEP